MHCMVSHCKCLKLLSRCEFGAVCRYSFRCGLCGWWGRWYLFKSVTSHSVNMLQPPITVLSSLPLLMAWGDALGAFKTPLGWLLVALRPTASEPETAGQLQRSWGSWWPSRASLPSLEEPRGGTLKGDGWDCINQQQSGLGEGAPWGCDGLFGMHLPSTKGIQERDQWLVYAVQNIRIHSGASLFLFLLQENGLCK